MNNYDIVILQFPERSSWKYIEQLRYIIDDIDFTSEEYSGKSIVMIAHYSAEDFISSCKEPIHTSINFMTKDWKMTTIDDL